MSDQRSAALAVLRVLLVTGQSGAGKSSVLRALEDEGYEAIDNLPLSLLSPLLEGPGVAASPVAVGVDIRTRGFDPSRIAGETARLRTECGKEVTLLFVDCEDETLRRRFTETRRRHPLAVDRPLVDGIQAERAVLSELRELADVVIDTSTYTLSDLRSELAERFAVDSARGLNVFVQSFAYGRGVPRGADLAFDVRFLRNPHYMDSLRPRTGRDPSVGAYIRADDQFDSFFDKLTALVLPLLPRYEREGKSYLTITLGCTGGRHRSVYVAERLAAVILDAGFQVTVRHRDIEPR